MENTLLLTVTETSKLMNVSRDTVVRWIKSGEVPVRRIRCSIRVPRAWIDNYVAECAPILLTRRQVSVKLGVSKYVVDGLRRRGLLPTVKVGGLTMVPACAVAEYVKRNTFQFLRARKAPATPSGNPCAVASLRLRDGEGSVELSFDRRKTSWTP